MEQFHGTTIISVRRGNQVALGGDGQVTLGNIVIKAPHAKFDVYIMTRFWPALRAQPPMRLPCKNVLKPS